jgi:hypothetical protein
VREATTAAALSAALSLTAAAVAATHGGLTAMALAWLGALVPTALWSAWRLRAPHTGVPR